MIPNSISCFPTPCFLPISIKDRETLLPDFQSSIKNTKNSPAMHDRNNRRFERATRVQTFGRDNAADFNAGSKGTELFAALDPIVVELTAERVGQLRGPVGKAALIDALSLDYKDIARTARAIRLDEPSFDDAPFAHPTTYAETAVATHADSLLRLLEDAATDTPPQLATKAALRARFLSYEIAADFVADLRADRDALDACNSAKHSDNLEGVESTSAIDTLLSNAQAIVTRLDAVIQNKYSRDPDKLAAWRSASRTERAPKKAEAPATPPPVA